MICRLGCAHGHQRTVVAAGCANLPHTVCPGSLFALLAGLCCVWQICKADIAGPEEGESKPDGKVDVHDLLKVLSGYSKKHETRHAGDIDNNMLVDVTDLLYVLKHYDKECPQQKRGFFG